MLKLIYLIFILDISKMNIKQELTCNYCNEIFQNPILLTCCNENICKAHIEELISSSSSSEFTCPLCNGENPNSKLNFNKFMQKMLENELHKFKIDAKHKNVFNNLRNEIENLDTIVINAESIIFDEMSELKRQVDLDREQLKMEIDELADGLIQQLQVYEDKFKAEYKKNFELENLNSLAESSRIHLNEYEKVLSSFSANKEGQDEKKKQSENLIRLIQTKKKRAKNALFSNLLIKYRPVETKKEDLFGRLVVNVGLNYNLNFFWQS